MYNNRCPVIVEIVAPLCYTTLQEPTQFKTTGARFDVLQTHKANASHGQAWEHNRCNVIPKK